VSHVANFIINIAVQLEKVPVAILYQIFVLVMSDDDRVARITPHLAEMMCATLSTVQQPAYPKRYADIFIQKLQQNMQQNMNVVASELTCMYMRPEQIQKFNKVTTDAIWMIRKIESKEIQKIQQGMALSTYRADTYYAKLNVFINNVCSVVIEWNRYKEQPDLDIEIHKHSDNLYVHFRQRTKHTR